MAEHAVHACIPAANVTAGPVNAGTEALNLSGLACLNKINLSE
jgi:hypothetical protein